MPTHPTTPFALDPTLPWLFSDPTMQEPAAFQGLRTVTLHDQTWEPMGQYFPGGTELAMRRVTALDQLRTGAAYWSEMDYAEQGKVKTSYGFGRYVGPAYPASKSTPRRWKQGAAHLTLESDVLDCDLRAYYLHEDGTCTRFVDVSANTHRLYQLTHYVNLPASLLAGLGTQAVKQASLTLRQATWLKQEQELRRSSYELIMQMQGGWQLPDYRVVLPHDQLRDFLSVQETCPQITPGQARKCKSGTLAITLRHSNNGREYRLTEHYKLVDAALLLDWMRHHSDLQNTVLNAAISRQAIGYHASHFRAQQTAARQAQAAAQASELECAGLSLPQQHDYAEVKELAHAA